MAPWWERGKTPRGRQGVNSLGSREEKPDSSLKVTGRNRKYEKGCRPDRKSDAEAPEGAVDAQTGWRKLSSRERPSHALPKESNDVIAFTLVQSHFISVQSHEGCSFHLPLPSPVVQAAASSGLKR